MGGGGITGLCVSDLKVVVSLCLMSVVLGVVVSVVVVVVVAGSLGACSVAAAAAENKS